jgi:hypothetical protein
VSQRRAAYPVAVVKSKAQAASDIFRETRKDFTGIAFPVNICEFGTVFLFAHLLKLAQE